MKTTFTLFFGVLLSVCLTLYGPFSVAPAKGVTVFSMEICADGVAKTVSFDVDGNPVDPAQNCPECLRCCQAVGNLTSTIFSAVPSFALLDSSADSLVAWNPVLNKRHLYPAPRGPLAVQISMLKPFKQMAIGRSGFGEQAHSDGRLLLKDASS